ncbi:hypothetical protein [Roseofilum sp. Guam]|uniref:hypothetical protein n=1 Tax=Roseofilum sp. Guam TaxID=2821502 RepID=UPI001AFF609B|nr:hypothetical protein [Roseofilum sp. Guam]MBP0027178.1 hypothetical protein [Roseofilum sp. Guam]
MVFLNNRSTSSYQTIAVRDTFRAKQETQESDRQFAEQVFSQVTDLFHSFEG